MSATASTLEISHLFDSSKWNDRLTGGAAITLKAAARHASRTGADRIAPSHLLLALLERPERRVRAFLEERGASLIWLCDTTLAGVSHLSPMHGPELDMIVETAHGEATSNGLARVDDYCLFLALLKHGDALSHRVLREAGVIPHAESPHAIAVETANAIASLVAVQGPFSPRIGMAQPRAIVRRPPLWRRHLRALFAAIELSPLFVAFVAVVIGTAALLASGPSERMVRPLIIGFIVSVWLVSLCLHEFGHAAAAFMFGDRQGQRFGYLTLDIRRYTHPFLSIVLPLISLIAGGLPLPGGAVMIDPAVTGSPRNNRLISLAGPAANLLCLALLSIPLWLGIDQWTPLGFALAGAASIQAGTIILNLLPIPPLDGWHIVSAGSSISVRAQAAALGFMPLLALMLLFRASPEFGVMYWAFVDALSALFNISAGPATAGRWMLRLS